MREELFVGGAWVPSTGTEWVPFENPATEKLITRVPDANAEDVDRAVAAARDAFGPWSATDPKERARLLTTLRDALKERQNEMAELITEEMGAPTKLARGPQTALPIGVLSSYADLLADPVEEEHIGNSVVMREPVGVVGAITPWNYPLHQAMAKIAPALAAGNTVVHKPSELTPLSAALLAELIEGAGFPLGVYNLVTGSGPGAGEALASHPRVDMISFTGSTRAGRRVAALAAETVKRVTLELGGKSANVILDDADLARAIPDAVGKCYLNSGQTCSALTRLIVPRSKLAEVEQLAAQTAAAFTTGDPFADGTRLGPLVSAPQRDRVRGYINKGIEEGAKLVTGGAEAPEGLDKGFFVQPTVFSEVTRDMTIARE